MKWFKHNCNAAQELPVRRIKAKYGYHGVGIYWCLMELVVMYEGTLCLTEVVEEFCSRYFSRQKVQELIKDAGCFVIDSNNNLTLAGKSESKTSADGVNTAHTNINNGSNKEKIEKKRDINALIAQSESPEEKEFYERMLAEYPRICQMQQPLTYQEMLRLVEKYTAEKVTAALSDMENYPKLLTGYLSASRTCRKWITT